MLLHSHQKIVADPAPTVVTKAFIAPRILKLSEYRKYVGTDDPAVSRAYTASSTRLRVHGRLYTSRVLRFPQPTIVSPRSTVKCGSNLICLVIRRCLQVRCPSAERPLGPRREHWTGESYTGNQAILVPLIRLLGIGFCFFVRYRKDPAPPLIYKFLVSSVSLAAFAESE